MSSRRFPSTLLDLSLVNSMSKAPETIKFCDGQLILIDQTKLPGELTDFVCSTIEQTHDAIRRLVVRGAPAIGIAAAYGVCLSRSANGGVPSRADYEHAIEYLATSRPTAVNLFWALDRMKACLDQLSDADSADGLMQEAIAIHEEDRLMCRAIGRNGADLIKTAGTVLTHCNAGGLATSTWGTALAPFYHLQEHGNAPRVLADETRPLLQGGRLTAWELSQAGIDVSVITDSMAGSLMRRGMIDAVIVGADRITRRGDVANKIGTYGLSVLANHHRIPFYVAAPTNTFDLNLHSGDDIPIEERAREEVSNPHGVKIVPDAAGVLNPAFDVTPAELISALVTEHGVIQNPTEEKIAEHFQSVAS